MQTELEHSNNRYIEEGRNYLNGESNLFAFSFAWFPKESRRLSLGLSYRKEKTQRQNYDNDTKTISVSWRENWQNVAISTQMLLSYSHRQYKDNFILGG